MNYEECFVQGFNYSLVIYGDEEMAKLFMEKFINLTYIEDNQLKLAVETYKKKDWKAFREHIHTIKGRLNYAGFEKFAAVFNDIQIKCDKNQIAEIPPLYREAMKIMSFLHERLLRFLNKEVVNVFKVEMEGNSDEMTQSQIKNEKKEEIKEEIANVEDSKQKFDKEFYQSQCSDIMNSKFKMYGFLEEFFKNDEGVVQNLLTLFQNNKIDETKNKIKGVLEMIENFGFHALENVAKEILQNNSDFKKTMDIFFFECSQLNKILRKHYDVEENCFFEYQRKSENTAENAEKLKQSNSLIENNRKENKAAMEKFKNYAFSKDGAITRLIKFYEENNYDKMKDELLELEKMTSALKLTNYSNALSFLLKATFLQNDDDIQKYIKLVCLESQRTHQYISDTLQLKREGFINYEELLSKINLENKYNRDNKLSRIVEIEDEKTSEKIEQISRLNITKEVSEIIIKTKKNEQFSNFNDVFLNDPENNENNDSNLLQKNYKSMKFNIFPGPTVRNLSEIGSEIKDFQLYYVKENKNEDYPFDSGLKCEIF